MFGRVEGRSVGQQVRRRRADVRRGRPAVGAADQRLGLVRRIARCFRDARDPRLVEHSVATRSSGSACFGLSLGYEDLNDHDESFVTTR